VAVVALLATTASDGKTYGVDHSNLDVILAVGHRPCEHHTCLRSGKAVAARAEALRVLSELILNVTSN